MKKIYLVATGEVVDGRETYTRHEDAPPPLCDYECLGSAAVDTMTKLAPRPPNDRGQGRKALSEADKLVVGSIRLSPAQWLKLERLGGAAWLRQKIDNAKGAK